MSNNSLNHMQILHEHRKFSEETGISFPNQLDLAQDQYGSNASKKMQPIPEEQSHRTYSESSTSVTKDKYHRKELLVMTIEIGNGRQETIHIHEDDDPAELAKEFCILHGLNPSIVVPLAQNIHHNIEQVYNDREFQQQQPTIKEENENSGEFNSQSQENEFQKYQENEDSNYSSPQSHERNQQMYSSEVTENSPLYVPYFIKDTPEDSKSKTKPKYLIAKTKSAKNLNMSYEGGYNNQVAGPKQNQQKRSRTPEFINKAANMEYSGAANKSSVFNPTIEEGIKLY